MGETKTLEEITFENTIKEGNVINVDGVKCKVVLVDHQVPKRADGGCYRVLFKPLNDILPEIQKHVSYKDSKDWYLLYQNGKK